MTTNVFEKVVLEANGTSRKVKKTSGQIHDRAIVFLITKKGYINYYLQFSKDLIDGGVCRKITLVYCCSFQSRHPFSLNEPPAINTASTCSGLAEHHSLLCFHEITNNGTEFFQKLGFV